jgi:hypothetical protein
MNHVPLAGAEWRCALSGRAASDFAHQRPGGGERGQPSAHAPPAPAPSPSRRACGSGRARGGANEVLRAAGRSPPSPPAPRAHRGRRRASPVAIMNTNPGVRCSARAVSWVWPSCRRARTCPRHFASSGSPAGRVETRRVPALSSTHGLRVATGGLARRPLARLHHIVEEVVCPVRVTGRTAWASCPSWSASCPLLLG